MSYPKYSGWNARGFTIVLFVLMAVSTFIPAQTLAASNIIFGDFQLQDNTSAVVASPIINSNLFFSVKLSNNGNLLQHYVVIFDVRDSKNYSIALMTENGNISKYTSAYVRSEWLPQIAGTYTVRTFALSDTKSPEVLSSTLSKSFQVLQSKPPTTPIVQTKQVEQKLPVQNTTVSKTLTLDELRKFALDKINEDRKQFDLAPVKLSDNPAAQVHADDVFKTKQISHWMTNGEKPYITYSRLGGTGFVSQNVAVWQTDADPKDAITELEHSMMYEDEECCDNGHRDNILDQYHTDVSIGISFDDMFIVMVQNFENNYLTPTPSAYPPPIFQFEEKSLTIDARIIDGEVKERQVDVSSSGGYTYYTYTAPILIYYDPPSTPSEYLKHKTDHSYSLGSRIACLVQFADNVQCENGKTINANSWTYYDSPDSDDILIRANLSDILNKDGVYTVVIWAEPPNSKPDEDVPTWQAASYSINWEG